MASRSCAAAFDASTATRRRCGIPAAAVHEALRSDVRLRYLSAELYPEDPENQDLLRDEDVEWWIYGVDPDLPQHRTPYVLDCVADVAQRGLDNLVWCGRFDDPQQAYGSVDALLVPSIKESFGRPALEGMASALPVVATRVAGLSEVVWDGVSGVLFDPDDPSEGARQLRAIVRDSSLRRELAAGAARRADQFDISTVGKTLEDVYRRLLG